MLVLTRKVGQKIHIGPDIVITVVRVQDDQIRVGIEAPSLVPVHREEVARRNSRPPGEAAVSGDETPG
jgi:carbon storage regulator